MNLRFYFFVSGVNQVEWERELSPRVPFITPRGLRASTQTYRKRGGLVWVWSVCR